MLQKQLEESEERNFELEANIATIQAETTYQVKTETQTWEEKVKYLEKQLQRQTTERRMAEVKLSEVKRLSVPGKSDSSLFSPPWKDRRKSDPLHHPPAVRPQEAAMRSSSIDRTPILTSDTSRYHAGANSVDNAMASSSQSTEYTNNTGKRDTAPKQRGIPVSENKTQQFEKTTKIKDADKKEISSISNSHLLITSASQVAVSLLQDMNDLMASTIRQLHRDDLEMYSQGINPLCQDWERIQSALRELINTNTSCNGNNKHTAGIELVVWTVLEIVASRKGDCISFEASSISNNLTVGGSRNDKSRRKRREATIETAIMINGGEESSSHYDGKQSHISCSKDMKDRPVTVHILNLLTFLERVIRLSTDARTFLTRELLYSSSASEANTMQDIDVTAETATSNSYGPGKTQKQTGDSPLPDDVHSSQAIRQSYKRRRIFAPRGITQPDLQVSKTRFHQPTASSKGSFSLFFGWMKSILFGQFMASDYDKSLWEEHTITETQNLEDLILLTFLKILSILFWESGCVCDERQLKDIASSDMWSISGLNSNLRSSIRIGEVLLFSLICSGKIDRDVSDEATVDSQESADLNSSRRQSLKSTDLLSAVFRSLRRRHHSEAVSGTNSVTATTEHLGYNARYTQLSEFQIKYTVINLYQKILASPSGSAFSRRIVFPGCSSDEGECVLFILYELDLCVRFLKESVSLDRRGLSNPCKFHNETAGKEVTGGAIKDEILDSSIHAMKVILNIIKFLIAYFQVDPPNGVAFLYHNYYLHGESKLHWCHQVTSRRKRHSEAGASGTREKSGISSLVEGLEYVVSALLGDTLQEKTKSQALRLESAYLLGLLVHSEMQLFALLLSHIQSVDYLAKSMFGDNVTSLLHLIGDAKACFRSSCSLISQYSHSCAFIDNSSRCHAQQLLEEIKLDEEEETPL